MKKKSIDWNILKEYVYKHCTSGDEDEIASMLRARWEEAGLCVEPLGRQALIAKPRIWQKEKPLILICAHADVPGYIVQQTPSPRKGIAVTLGGPHCKEGKNAVQLKSIDGKITAGNLEEDCGDYIVTSRCAIERGTRVCWAPAFKEDDEFIQAPFLDNRIGCLLLHLLAGYKTNCNAVLAVTGTEECLGFGAAALARHLSPDMVIVLDTTYIEPNQNVLFGKGPVLTVCDKSIMIGNRQIRALQNLCSSWNIPLQYEIYNYAGTDAAAFTKGGHTSPVLPLLIATEGNHSCKEKVAKADIEMTLALLKKLLSAPESIEMLRCSF